jgi:acetylornithine/N-succinyldiaminopimelate aminotransferase
VRDERKGFFHEKAIRDKASCANRSRSALVLKTAGTTFQLLMKEASTRELFDDYVVPSYGRYEVVLTRGRGSRVWDENGKEYLDFGAGIAVSILGHNHPAIVSALEHQARTLIHTSNLYYTRPQGELARRLVEIVGEDGKVFFSNSGAEANEAAIKLARRFGTATSSADQPEPRYEILTFDRSFHGRTMAGISATAQAKVKTGFGPLLPGFRHLPFNDLVAVEQAISGQTVGVLLEAVQGEGGIFACSPEFLVGLRHLCDDHGLLLMLDEIQCGMGRLGFWCGWKAVAEEVVPDCVSWAKGIGGGFPLGATWIRKKRITAGAERFLCDLLDPGSHGTTYGGTPLACAVSLAVFSTLEKEGLVVRAGDLGRSLLPRLAQLPGVKEVRGKGLMLGIELDDMGASSGSEPLSQTIVKRLMTNGLLTVPAGPKVVRLLPPLNVTPEEVEDALAILTKTLA